MPPARRRETTRGDRNEETASGSKITSLTEVGPRYGIVREEPEPPSAHETSSQKHGRTIRNTKHRANPTKVGAARFCCRKRSAGSEHFHSCYREALIPSAILGSTANQDDSTGRNLFIGILVLRPKQVWVGRRQTESDLPYRWTRPRRSAVTTACVRSVTSSRIRIALT